MCVCVSVEFWILLDVVVQFKTIKKPKILKKKKKTSKPHAERERESTSSKCSGSLFKWQVHFHFQCFDRPRD